MGSVPPTIPPIWVPAPARTAARAPAAPLRAPRNPVLVVQHDEDPIRAGDHLVDMGPGAGAHGGKVIAEGTPEEVMQNSASLTGQYLSGFRQIPIPKERREPRNTGN